MDLFLTVCAAWSPHGMMEPSRKARQCSALEEEVGMGKQSGEAKGDLSFPSL